MEAPQQPHAGLAPHNCGRCCTQIENLGVVLDGHRIIEEVSLHLHCGELTTIVGPNGAGKTTLLRALLGEVPHTGKIHFLPVAGRESAPAMGYVPQQLDFDRTAPVSVHDLFAVAFSRRPVALGYAHSTRAVALAALRNVEAERLLNRRLGRLSGGELQRVLLALALTPPPNLLLLDEPVAAIDHAGRELFYRIVDALRLRLDLTILMVSHDLATAAAFSDRLVFLDRWLICAGPPAAVLAHPALRHTFGLDLAVEAPPRS